MFEVTGPYLVLAMLLLVSGVRKLRRPELTVRALRAGGLPATTAAVHAFGSAQLAVAAGALLVGGAHFAVLTALACVARGSTFAWSAARYRLAASRRHVAVGTPADASTRGTGRGPIAGSVRGDDAREVIVRDFAVRAGAALVAAVVAVIAAVVDVGSMPETMAPEPLWGLPFLVATVACAWCLRRAAAALSSTRPHP